MTYSLSDISTGRSNGNLNKPKENLWFLCSYLPLPSQCGTMSDQLLKQNLVIYTYIYISLKILNLQCSGFMFTFLKICSKYNSYKAVCHLRFCFWYILFKIATTSSNIIKKLLYYLFLIKKATHVLGTTEKLQKENGYYRWFLCHEINISF